MTCSAIQVIREIEDVLQRREGRNFGSFPRVPKPSLILTAAVLTVAIAASATLSAADLPEDRGAVGLWQSLKKLGTTARVMHVTAHPDDEDGGTLTLLSRGHGVEVTLASITRGESGANLVTGDFFDGLGALRTLELGKAAEYYGADVRFSRYADYGFSKNLEEALRTWDREEILRDFVRIIRAEKPHIILARFRGGFRAGHGQHQIAGLIAQEAYKAAGDPARFPELAREGCLFEAERRPKVDAVGRRLALQWGRSGVNLRALPEGPAGAGLYNRSSA